MAKDFDSERRRFLGTGAGLTASWFLAPCIGIPRSQALAAEPVWESVPVYIDQSGKLMYRSDQEGNRIPDFSYAGYHNGDRALPNVPVVQQISPVSGDSTAHIQNAIDAVGSMPRDANGFRGAVLLQAGRYEVSEPIHLKRSGVVLRGVGDGPYELENTIIYSTDTRTNYDVIRVSSTNPGSNTSWSGQVSGTRTNIETSFVPVGARTFRVADAGPLSVGDNIIIVHPCTQQWLDAIGGGGTDSDPPWGVGDLPIMYNRFITAISGNHVTVDAPMYNHLDRNLSQCYLYKWDRQALITEVGIEHIRVDIGYSDATDENHARDAIRFVNVQDAWVRNCTMLHFWHSGINTFRTTRATIRNCEARDPISRVEGSRRYNFNVSTASQQILFERCSATKARHAFVSNGTSTASGIVFLRCTSKRGILMSEGHRMWTQGMLFDGFIESLPENNGNSLGFYNRGRYGGSHGWGAAHCVAWVANVPLDQSIIIQKPPTAQNYAIGCFGNVTGNGPFEHPAGYIRGTGDSNLSPDSLYQAQLTERLNTSYRHFPVLQDAYVRGGSYANSNYGGSSTLMIKSASLEYTRWAFLKFDLTGVDVGSLNNARLRVVAKHLSSENSGFQGTWVRAYGVSNTSWSADTITWNNKPYLHNNVLQSRPVAGPTAEFEWDVTGWVRSELQAGRDLISLALVCSSQRSAPVYVYARNQSDYVAPQLLVDDGGV